MELKAGDYSAGLRMVQGAVEALQAVVTSLKRQDDASRIRRGIEEAEFILKKVKRQLRIG
ncbi:MAG: hypothetical protein Q8Q14_05230 [Gemmatimonadales bacterium]|nr:hypothetical protein [Gemmatimonadales bacterium]